MQIGFKKIGFICVAVLTTLSCHSLKQKPNSKYMKYPIISGENYVKLRKIIQTQLGKSTQEQKKDIEEFLQPQELPTHYLEYKPDSNELSQLKLALNGKELFIDVFGGNWCSDTRQGLAGLSKVLDDCGFNSANFEYYRVNRDKKIIDNIDTKYKKGDLVGNGNDHRVPLVIVRNKSTELGVIVEMPNRGRWELGLLEILRQAN